MPSHLSLRLAGVAVSSCVLVTLGLSSSAEAGTPGLVAGRTIAWTGNGLSVVDGVTGFQTTACNASSDPVVTFVLAGTSATTATIRISGTSRPMAKVRTGANASAWKYTYSSPTPLDPAALLASGVSATYDGMTRGTLTAGSGCTGPAAPAVPSFSLGGDHTCAVTTSGTLKCWGGNMSGELGVGDFDNRLTPTVSLGGATVKRVALGYMHSCAILSNDSLSCWGWNGHGQVGIGGVSFGETPAVVNLGGLTAKAVSAGYAHTCAIRSNGSVMCWGRNIEGELGVGDTLRRETPVLVGLGGHTAKAIAVGGVHTCAILDDDSLSCWGANYSGQLGIGGTTDRLSPVAVPLGGKKAKAVSVGDSHTCVLLADTGVACWGWNGYGQLGVGDNADHDAPSPVNLGGHGAKALDAGLLHTCAILDDDSAVCWGYNGQGELGNGDTTNTNVPVPVSLTGRRARAIDAGDLHTCATLSDGTFACWGFNYDGQLGLGDEDFRSTPTAVTLGA